METKKLITLRGAVFFLALLLVAAILFFWLDSSPQAVTATVEVDGSPVLTQNLTALEEPSAATFSGTDGHTVTIEFTPTSARFLSSTCPDQTCVRTGTLTHAGETALCLPARISLRLTGPDAGFDATTY